MPIDFRVRDFFHPFNIWNLHRTLDRTQWLPPQEVLNYQNHRLAHILDQAYNHVPYYRRLFERLRLHPSRVRQLEDLKKLPLLKKDTVRVEAAGLLADNARRYHPRLYKTGGNSGEPLNFYLDKKADVLEFVYYWRHWSWAGFKLGDRFAQLHGEHFLGRTNLSQQVSIWQPHLRRLLLNSGQVSLCRAKEMATSLRKYRPKFLKGMATALYSLALSLKETGINDVSFSAVFSSGEVLTPQHRGLIEQVFGCLLLDSYGHMERTVGICQCPAGSYHVNWDYGLLEVESSQVSPYGKTALGRVIGTSLYNHSMPFIRYDVGDDIEIFPDPETCSCGRTLPIVKAVHGRTQDTVITPDGRFITSLFILPEFVEGIRFVQFVQDAESELAIRLVPDKDWDRAQEEKLLHYTAQLTGPHMRVSIVYSTPGDLIRDPSGKFRVVLSRC